MDTVMARVDATDMVKDTDRKAAIITVKDMDLRAAITARAMGMENVTTTAKDTDQCMGMVQATARDTTEALAEREYSA